MSTVALADIVAYLDDYLRIGEIPDSPNAVNGLEVENRSGTVDRIVAAVDGGCGRRTGWAGRAGRMNRASGRTIRALGRTIRALGRTAVRPY